MSDARTYVSLFAGTGGLDRAAEALGYRCVAQVEWDKHCTAVLERHWPDVPRWSDVRDFGAAAYADRGRQQGRKEPVGDTAQPRLGAPRRGDAHGCGLIVAGFPCQPASTAGRRKGTADDRWLWPEVARVVGEFRPRSVLLENVPGLLTVGGGGAFSDVLADLAALGYVGSWTCVRASDVGACHRRERIFILAHLDDPEGFGRGVGLAEDVGPVEGDVHASRHADRLPAPHPDNRRHPTLLGPPSLTGLHAEGAGAEPAGADRGTATDTAQQRSQRNGRARNGRDGSSDNGGFPWGRYAPAIARHEAAFGRPAPHPIDEKGRLDPAFVGWMMDFDAGWTEGVSRTQALKMYGNAVVATQAVEAFLRLKEAR